MQVAHGKAVQWILALAMGAVPSTGEVEAMGRARELRQRVSEIRGPGSLNETAPLIDFEHYDVDIRWDFRTGDIAGTGTLTFHPVGTTPLSELMLLMDPGLAQLEASDALGPLSVTLHLTGDQRLAVINLRSTTAMTLHWQGTLQCPHTGVWGCAKGALPFVAMDRGSGIPLPLDGTGVSEDAVHARWTLRTPIGYAIHVSGDLVQRSQNAGELVTQWATARPTSLGLSSWVITGMALTEHPLAQTPIFSTSTAHATAVASWAPQIVSEITRRFGALPSQTVAQIVVPRSVDFIGTASASSTLINERYDVLGPFNYEASWAHENLHQHFGVRAHPTDMARTVLMVEGITTLLQIEHSHRALTGIERDRMLGRRMREVALVLQSMYPQALTIPLVVANEAQWPREPRLYNAWGYFKGAATLELLRVAESDATFDLALNDYLRACDAAPCMVSTFKRVLEQRSGKDLSRFWSEWVMGARNVHLTIDWSPTGPANEIDITLRQDQAGLVPLELWAELTSGDLQRVPWSLEAVEERKHLQTSAPVRRLRINPRLETVIQTRSATNGDVDFDGEVDGFDIIRCARLVGQTTTMPVSSETIWATNLDFDPQCDRNRDATISQADLALLPFNTLRAMP